MEINLTMIQAIHINYVKLYPKMPELLEVAHVSKRGSSLRISVPKKIQVKLSVFEEDIIGFYEENGKIYLKKME